MMSTMKEQDLRDKANKVTAEFQTEADFETFTKARSKQFRESGMEGERDDHLGYEKRKARDNETGNSRNGKTSNHRCPTRKSPQRSTPPHASQQIQPIAVIDHRASIMVIHDRYI